MAHCLAHGESTTYYREEEVGNPNNNCAICLEDFKDAKLIEFNCRHSCHENCGLDWIRQNASCPICRKELTGVNK